MKAFYMFSRAPICAPSAFHTYMQRGHGMCVRSDGVVPAWQYSYRVGRWSLGKHWYRTMETKRSDHVETKHVPFDQEDLQGSLTWTQAILCAADDTLEKPVKTVNRRGSQVEEIDGIGHAHQCRNATILDQRVLESELSPVKAAPIRRDTRFP